MSKLITKRNAAILIFGLLIVAIGARCLLNLPAVQDRALSRGASVMAERAAEPLPESESLRVFVCGSASPLGTTDQAQTCIAVLTPEHFYLIDSGAGSTNNINRLRLPMRDLDGLLLTHFHSDHIAEIYEVNLASWVQGRPTPLTVYGPSGVDEVTEAVNAGYRLDRKYRTDHHGEDLLPPELGVLSHQTIASGVILADGDLKLTAFVSEHPPLHPAVGYRFDYRGRSVVISGDSNVTDETRKIADGADLLLHDALSLPIVTTMSEALAAAGQTRPSKIVTDVIDYHASTGTLIDLGAQIDVDMVVFYHLVPSPMNSVLANIFMRDAPDNYLLAKDRMWFELPIGNDDIIVTRP
jgi:ribonuclease Z